MDITTEGTALLRPAEVAAHLRVSRSTVYRYIASGQIEAVHIGGGDATRITREALAAFIDRAGRSSRRSA